MTVFDEKISAVLSGWSINCEPSLEGFCDFLLSENQKYNLTAVRDKDGVALKHMADSLFLLSCADFAGKKVLDIGCGAGFPGLPLKLCCPSLELYSMDSTAKKTNFVKMAAEREGQAVNILTGRAEELCRPPLRESFDIVVSRAVAELGVLSELCIPYLKRGGLFLSMKNAGDAELSAAAPIIEKLGGRVEKTVEYEIPGVEGRRQVIIIEKVKNTPEAYPRQYSKIASDHKKRMK